MFIVLGLFISLVYSHYILPKKEGIEPNINPTLYPIMYRGMLIIPYSKKAIHLHHWILYSCVCLIGCIVQIPGIFIGFSLGLAIQGFQYKDSCKFICDNPY